MCRFFSFLACLALLAAAVLGAAPAAADIRLLGDWTYSYSDAETEDRDTGERTDSQSDRFRQLYRADLSRQVYPTLLVNGGVLFEKTELDSEIDGDDSEITGEVLRPYIDAELGNTLYTLAAGYRQSEITNEGSDLMTTEQDVEEYDLRGEWRPVELPHVEATYTRTDRQTTPSTGDRTSHLFRLTTDYAYGDYDFLYNYLRNEDEQHGLGLEGTDDTRSLTRTHNGRVRYAGTFLDRRVSVNARLQAERSTVEFSGSGERIIRTIPFGAGFFLLEDLVPETNVPGEFTTGPFTDVDIGGGGGTDPLSVGLAYGDDVTVDRLRILLDPALEVTLRQEIDRLESEWDWRIYVSDDQLTWDSIPVLAVNYDPIDHYFEIRFPRTTGVEFIKAVTTPVTRDPLTQDILPPIRIVSVESFVALATGEDDEVVSISRQANFGAGWKVTDSTRFGYELAYQDQEVDVFDIENRQLSNVFNAMHVINPNITSSARVMRTDRWEGGEHDTTTHQLTAQLMGRYLPTLRQSLTYSGDWSDEPEGNSSSHSVFLRTNAELYRGWDVSFDQGQTWQDRAEQGKLSSFFLRVDSSIVPHRRLNFFADYSVRWTDQEQGDDRRDQSGRVRGYWVPTDTLSLFAEIGLRETEDGTFTEWEYGGSWLPLRDGTLQVNLRYSEEGDTDDELLRSFSPSLTWEVARRTYLTLSYTRGKQEDRNEKSDFESAQANLRIFYD